ncbi:site-specific integrase [Chryseobacterium koreense]|uniref:tyrosine-type recombinase/integrase n=1 Tax=Chryseobacterium koreense TaxID=232216 RepID=UPI0026EDA00D|nr:site-specific integrase [Chryseobacterium koreense]
MDFKSYLRNRELSKTTIESYYNHTMYFIAFLDKDNTEVENCTEKEILLYLKKMQKNGVSQKTKLLRIYALRHFFEYQIETGIRTDNPAKRIKLKGGQKQKIYPNLTAQELQELYQNYEVPKTGDKRSHHNWFSNYRISRERNKVMLGLFVYQGITTAEAKRILTEDLDLRSGKIDIRGGRIGRDRTLELKSHQIMDLMEYLYKTRAELLKYQSNPETKQLFLSMPPSGKLKSESDETLNIFKRFTEELKAQYPKLINIQHIRTSVIINWLKKYNLRQVQYRAGHKAIYATELYLVNDIDDLQTEINQYHPLS